MVSSQALDNTQPFDLKKHIPLLAVLLSGAFITILNQTLLATALPPIMNDLKISESTVQWLQFIFNRYEFVCSRHNGYCVLALPF
ncbi:hypothetical protein [Planococcus sp. ISL-110]|uniref:hypothetical protein n=1 Tax=Planococcus sp. ISL-110 TaxID=2819167 RepID=UPI002035BF0E|nr:hypothetical protein [Planococcus sp. ISL-110]